MNKQFLNYGLLILLCLSIAWTTWDPEWFQSPDNGYENAIHDQFNANHPLNTSYPVDRSDTTRKIAVMSRPVQGELTIRIEIPPHLQLDTLTMPYSVCHLVKNVHGEFFLIDIKNSTARYIGTEPGRIGINTVPLF